MSRRLILAGVAVALVTGSLLLAISSREEAPLPPRPLFHNDWGEHEFDWSGSWYPCLPLQDQVGNFAIADFEDNHLLLIVSNSYLGPFPPLAPVDLDRVRLCEGASIECDIEREIDLVQVIVDGRVVLKKSLNDNAARDRYDEWFYARPHSFVDAMQPSVDGE